MTAANVSESVLDFETRRATRAFMEIFEDRYPVKAAFLFGSRARHTHNPDSDADIAIILMGEPGNRHKIAGDMVGIAVDLLLETRILVDPTPFWQDEFKNPGQFSNPSLIETIKREGLRL